MTLLLKKYEKENIILNMEIESNEILIDIVDLDMNIHSMNDKLCYYLPVIKSVEFRSRDDVKDIYDTLKINKKWKVSTKKVCE